MRDYLIKRPMLLCGMGCVAVSYIAFYSKTLLTIILFTLPIILGFLIFKKADTRLIAVSVLLFVMCISCVSVMREINEIGYHEGTTINAELVIYDVTYKSDEYYVADAEIIESDRLNSGTKITVFLEPLDITSGQRLRADVSLRALNDNYKQSSYSEGIYIQGYMSKISLLEDGDLILTTAKKLRNYIKNTLLKYTDYSETATLCALIFGERDYFTDEFYGCVKTSGVAHVMVVSGMHMAILVNFFTKWAEKIFYSRYLKAFIMVFIVLILWVICGFTMSVLRAGVTYLLMALGTLIDRKGKPENTLGAAVSLILITSPFAMLSISLQLSVLSTFGILAVAIPITDYIKQNEIIKSETVLKILSSVLMSVSALLLTLPVTIYVFGYISSVSILTNLLISSAVTFDLTVAVLAILVNLFSATLSAPLFGVANIVTKYINYVIIDFGNLPFATVDTPKYFSFISAFAILLILCVLLACKKRINMLKLKAMNEKIIKEGGGKLKWRQ